MNKLFYMTIRWLSILEYLLFFRTKIKIMGVTGTNGKGTVVHLISNILNYNGIKCASMGTVDIFDGEKREVSYLTTHHFQDILRIIKQAIRNDCSYMAMEISSDSISSKRIRGLNFFMKILTNIQPDHLDLHESFEKYALLKKDFFNSSDCLKISSVKPKLLTCTLSGITFKYDGCVFKSKLIGEFNVDNCAQAIQACKIIGLSNKQIHDGLQEASSLSGRFELVHRNPLVFIDFATNPSGLENVLSAAKKLTKGKLIHVFGCAGDVKRYSRAERAFVSEKYSDIIIVTSDNTKKEAHMNIFEDIKKGFVKRKFIIIQDRVEALKYAGQIAKQKDTIIITGKGSQRFIYDGIKKPFHDSIILDFL